PAEAVVRQWPIDSSSLVRDSALRGEFEGFVVSPNSVSVDRGGPLLFKPPLDKGLFSDGYQPFGQDIGTPTALRPTGSRANMLAKRQVCITTGLAGRYRAEL